MINALYGDIKETLLRNNSEKHAIKGKSGSML
jgi:hypothetical protein